MVKVCDHDCFHCKFSDCIDGGAPFSEESDIIDALYRQDEKIQSMRIGVMAAHNMTNIEIAAVLGIPIKRVTNIKHNIRKKKATTRLASE